MWNDPDWADEIATEVLNEMGYGFSAEAGYPIAAAIRKAKADGVKEGSQMTANGLNALRTNKPLAKPIKLR